MSRLFGDGARGGVREAVARAHDERIEREPRQQLAVEPLSCARRRLGRDRPCRGGGRGGRGARRQRTGFARDEAYVRAAPDHVGERVPQGGQVMFVDPVHEEGVGDFQFGHFGPQLEGHDGAEPGFEGLFAGDPGLEIFEDLYPENGDLIRGNGQDGHFRHPCRDGWRRHARGEEPSQVLAFRAPGRVLAAGATIRGRVVHIRGHGIQIVMQQRLGRLPGKVLHRSVHSALTSPRDGVSPRGRIGQEPTRKGIAGNGLWGWSGPAAGRFVGHAPGRGRKASTRPHAPQGTSLPHVMPWGSWHYGGAAGRRDQNGNRTPKVTAKSSLTSSLTASCTSESRRRYGLGLYSIPMRSGQEVSVVVSRPTSMRENNSAAPP